MLICWSSGAYQLVIWCLPAGHLVLTCWSSGAYLLVIWCLPAGHMVLTCWSSGAYLLVIWCLPGHLVLTCWSSGVQVPQTILLLSLRLDDQYRCPATEPTKTKPSCGQTNRHTDRTDRQTKQTHTHRDKQTDRQTDRQTDKKLIRHSAVPPPSGHSRSITVQCAHCSG